MGIIYKATCKINNKRYIGQTIRDLDERIKDHKNAAYSNKKEYSMFHRAIRKYGFENFIWEVICECDDLNLNIKEKEYIKLEKSHSSQGGYNLTWGGDNNFGASGEFHWLNRREDREDWIKNNRIGENNPNYNNGEAISGEKHFLNKMTKEEKEKWLDENLRGDNNYQKHLSPEERKKKHWINNKTEEEIKLFKQKVSGENNGFAKKMRTDKEFRENFLKKCKPPLITKQWKITFQNGETVIIDNITKYIRENQPEWNRNGVASAVHYKRKYKGCYIEEYNEEENEI